VRVVVMKVVVVVLVVAFVFWVVFLFLPWGAAWFPFRSFVSGCGHVCFFGAVVFGSNVVVGILGFLIFLRLVGGTVLFSG